MTLTPALQAKKAALEAKGARVSVAPDGSLKWRYPAARAPAVGKETAAVDALAGADETPAAPPATGAGSKPRAPKAPPAPAEGSGVGALVAVAVGLVGVGFFAWSVLRRRRESAASPAPAERSNVVPIRSSALH